MSVYVDDAIHPFGRMRMCHLFSNSLEELLKMVDIIGVQRKWIQGHSDLSFGKHKNASWIHFDISKGKRDLAIRHGAIATDRYGPLIHTAKLDIVHSDLKIQQYGWRRLHMAVKARLNREVVFRFSRRYNQVTSIEGL